MTLGTYCTTRRMSQSSCWCGTCLRRVGAACLVVTHAGARPGARPCSAATMTIASSSLSALRAAVVLVVVPPAAAAGCAGDDVTHVAHPRAVTIDIIRRRCARMPHACACSPRAAA